jgi:Protein of unknown function (DUF3579)
MRYLPHVHPVTSGGVRCLVVGARVEEIEPRTYRFLLHFAKGNELRSREGRLAARTELDGLQRAGDAG